MPRVRGDPEEGGVHMIVVNLFGGPGCGKSTGAAYIFARLKERGANVELVTEFAKDLVWDGSGGIADQAYVLGNQFHRLYRCERAGVQVAVTDSPLLLSLVYRRPNEGPFGDEFAAYVRACHRHFANLNFLVARWKPYKRTGRIETETEATERDRAIAGLLEAELPSEFTRIEGLTPGYEVVVEAVARHLEMAKVREGSRDGYR